MLVRGAGANREVLLLKRPSHSAFAADAWVFPGGRVDEADHRFDLATHTTGPDAADWAGRLEVDDTLATAFVVAGLRETWEETGILLADGCAGTDLAGERRGLLVGSLDFADVLRRHEIRLATHRLRYLGRRITPRGFARRFDTRFFLAGVGAEARCTLVGDELVEARWRRARDALLDVERGAIAMLPPTIDTLRRLEGGEL